MNQILVPFHTMKSTLPEVIKTRDILHRVTAHETGPKITEEQYIRMPDGTITVVQFHRYDSGKLVWVTQRSLRDGETV